jgi:hypothetical protein
MTTAAQTRRPRRKLTAQSWFPGALALWFAALFGLISLALPPEVLERAVVALRLDRVFAAAAPPLGETARLLIAVAAPTVGEIVGLLLGRALGGKRAAPVAMSDADQDEACDEAWPPPERRAQERRFEAPRRPLFASEDLVLADEPDEAVVEPTFDQPEEALEPACEPVVEAAVDAPEAASAEPELETVAPVVALSPLAAAPLEDLGAAQLTERLALALTARKERGDGVPAGLGNRLGALAGLERARLGGWSEETSDDPEAVEDEDEDEAVDEASYSSLLDIGPHRAGMRGEEPAIEDEESDADWPAPPRAADAEPDETDRALKAALDSLQRFSGTR